MPKRRAHSSYSPALALFTAVFACASARPPSSFDGPPPTTPADRQMAMLAEQYLDSALELDPILASYVGYHKWDGRMPDYSSRGIRRAIQTHQRFAGELKKIDKPKLSAPWAIDYELIQGRIEHALFVLKELRPFEWDVQMYNEAIGGGLYYLTVPPRDPADVPARLNAVISRLEALPRFLDIAKAKLAKPPKVFTELVIQQNPGNIDTIEKILPPLFAEHPTLAAKLAAASPRAVAALKDFQAFLEGELLERSTGDWRLGRSLWEKKLRHTLGAQMSLDDLYAGAERGLELTRLEMYDAALPVYLEQFPDDRSHLEMLTEERINHVVGRVLREAAKDHGTAATFFADVEKKAASIRAFIERERFIALPPPDDAFEIAPTPPFLDGVAVAFFNPAPAFEPDAKKSFWISSVPEAGTADAEATCRSTTITRSSRSRSTRHSPATTCRCTGRATARTRR